jgi:hypothetical protein
MLEENIQLLSLSERPLLSYQWTTAKRTGKMGPKLHGISVSCNRSCMFGLTDGTLEQNNLLSSWLSLSVEISQIIQSIPHLIQPEAK